MDKYPSQSQDKFTVRFPDGMRDVIAQMAKEHGRSMNSEIVDLISIGIKACVDFGSEDGSLVAEFQRQLKEIHEKLNALELNMPPRDDNKKPT